MKKLIIFYINIIFFTMTGVVFANVVSKNPNYLKTDASQTELLFESMISCMHSVQSGDDNIIISQEPREEIEKFVNSLTNQQLEKITEFVESMPTMKHEQKFTCKKCQHENTVELKGLQDFF